MELDEKIMVLLNGSEDGQINCSDTEWCKRLQTEDYQDVHDALGRLHAARRIVWYREGDGETNSAQLL